jgi:hypothetical protein
MYFAVSPPPEALHSVSLQTTCSPEAQQQDDSQ